MRVAIVGLALTHPAIYAGVLLRSGVQIGRVWDSDAEQAAAFARQFGGKVAPTPEAALDDVDGVIVTSRAPERTRHALSSIERLLPTYIGKPLASSPEDLELLIDAARQAACPIMSTSVLRFAPSIQDLGRILHDGSLGTVLSVTARSAHSIESYLREPKRWHDDPARGGGTIVTMGIHAFEPLVALFGRDVESVYCTAARRHFHETFSEDAASMLVRWRSGLAATVEVLGGFSMARPEHYRLEVSGSLRARSTHLPGDGDPVIELGYEATMNAFVRMCDSRESPVSLDETEIVIRALLAARKSAELRDVVML